MTQKTLELIINDAQAAASVGDIKKQLKALQSEMIRIGEGGQGFDQLAMAAGELKEKMNQAQEAVSNFNPDALEAVGNFASKAASGVSLVTGAMSLFGSESKDTEKALMKVQAAMAFTQGIQGIKGLGKSLQNLFNLIAANPIMAIVTAVLALGVAVAKFYSEQAKANLESSKLTAQLEKQKEVTTQMTAQYEAQITILEAQGNSEREIFELKKQMMQQQLEDLKLSVEVHRAKLREIADNDSLYESFLRVASTVEGWLGLTKDQENAQALIAQNKKERAEEEQKLLNDELNQITALQASITALEITETKRLENVGKAQADANEKKRVDQQAANDQMVADMQELGDRLYAEQVAINEAQEQLEAEHNKHREQLYLDDVAKKKAAEIEKYKAAKKRADLERKLDEMRHQLAVDTLKSTLGAIGDLMKDNADAQKAITAAMTLIDTYFAAQKAYSSQMSIPSPDAPVRAAIAAGAAIVQGLARVAAILRVNTDNPSSGGAGATGGGNTGSLSFSTQPNINPAATPTTILNQTTNTTQAPMFVSVTEINETNGIVHAAENRNRF